MMQPAIYSFWSLIQEYKIRIPIIQRDYAQGRKSPDVVGIRTNFLQSLYDATVNGIHLDLDFVYGSSKDMDKQKVFQPLDGQQRLTTLFLLHWYLAWKEGHLHKDNIATLLKRFTYETRTSSRDFCIKICDYKSGFFSNETNTISKLLKDEAWFYSSWEKDQTIKSMLTMLDAIHRKFKDTENLFNVLVHEMPPRITFHFIELVNFGLDDSLYIKMNARGKPLTRFENFKAKLEQHVKKIEARSELPSGYAERFLKKLDTDWSDLFWFYREKKTNTFDQQFQTFFQKMLDYYEHVHFGDSMGIDSFNKPYSFSRYENLIDAKSISDIERVLDALSGQQLGIKRYLAVSSLFGEELHFVDIIENNDITYAKLLRFYAYCCYLSKHKGNINSNSFSDWMRIICNLVENNIYNRRTEYVNSLISVLAMVDYSDNIIDYFCLNGTQIKGFSESSITEEILKAKLIKIGNGWKDIIMKAESHPYFRGQIYFLLDFAGITTGNNNILKWSQEQTQSYQDAFNNYYSKMSRIFGDQALLVDESLFRSALLSEGNYLLRKGENLSFVINTLDRDISWKRLLTINDKRKLVKQLVDSLDFSSINESLKIHKNNMLSMIRENDWRRNFIVFPQLISKEYCGSNLFIRTYASGEILLLTTTRTSGYCYEYFSLALAVELSQKVRSNVKIQYIRSQGSNNYKYFRIFLDGEVIYVVYDSDKTKWLLCHDWNGKWDYEFKSKHEVIDFLKERALIKE